MKTIEYIAVAPQKKIYFVSDFHLGSPNIEESRIREKHIVQWLEEISEEAQTVFLLGDIFDFWFEYKNVVPKGYVRLLGKLAEMSDHGIDLRMFVGNHDLWSFGYLEHEIGIKTYTRPQLFKINETLCLIGHGDGLGHGDYIYKFLKGIFSCKVAQLAYAFIHPRIGVGLATFFSRRKRTKTGKKDPVFSSKESEPLYLFCKDYLKQHPQHKVQYFIFGHRHLPLKIELSENSTYFNTGDWLSYNSFLECEFV